MPRDSHESAFDNVPVDGEAPAEVSVPKRNSRASRRGDPRYKQVGPLVLETIMLEAKHKGERNGMNLSELTELLYLAYIEDRVKF